MRSKENKCICHKTFSVIRNNVRILITKLNLSISSVYRYRVIEICEDIYMDVTKQGMVSSDINLTHLTECHTL